MILGVILVEIMDLECVHRWLSIELKMKLCNHTVNKLNAIEKSE